MKSNEYQCEQCSGIYEKDHTEEEVWKEAEENGFGDIPKEDTAIVCDDCYKELMAMHQGAFG